MNPYMKNIGDLWRTSPDGHFHRRCCPNCEKPAPGPIIPMGDCRCGKKPEPNMVEANGEKYLNRPWMVHFKIMLPNTEVIIVGWLFH